MKRRCLYLPLISLIFLTFASCRQKYFTSEGKTWGTTYHITYQNDVPLDSEIIKTLGLVDSELSMFNPSSKVSAINSGADSVASEHFRKVFETAKRISELSNFVYDPTIGPISDLWGFGRNEINGQPSDSAIEAALAAVGIAECSISESGIVHKKSPATVFDFSSVAKGYGIDLVGAMLQKNGVKNYMIEIGGEILVLGVNPDGRPWHIQIDAPSSGPGHRPMEILSLGPEKTAVASSGNYRNYRHRTDGTTYGHTLSPITGRPVQGQIAAATIIASDCATADAMATACMAAAVPDSAMAIIRRGDVRGIVAAVAGDSLKVFR